MREIDEDSGVKLLKWVFAIAVFAILFLLLNPIVIVPAGYQGVVKTWGAATDVMSPGFNLKIPIAQDIEMMETRTIKYDTPASAATKDLLDVETQIAVNYHLLDGSVSEIYQSVGISYQERLIVPAVQETVKAVTAKFDAEQLVKERAVVKLAIDNNLKERLAERKIIVETVSITDFKFPEKFNQAIIDKQTAVQLKQKAENDLERIKVEAEQARAQAEGQANAKIEIAKADATAIDIINQQLLKSPTYIDFLAVQRWNGILPAVTGGATPFVNIDTITGTQT